MITIVTFFQFGADFFVSHFLFICQDMQVFFHDIVDFFFCDSAEFHVLFVHRNIYQVVQVAEYTDFTELGDTCQESKFDMTVHSFQYTIESLHRIAEFSLKWFVAYCL